MRLGALTPLQRALVAIALLGALMGIAGTREYRHNAK
jgi:hypothetical protein